MSDKVELTINDVKFDRFKAYNVSSDIYEAADSFSFDIIPQNSFSPRSGMICRLYVNGEIELTGIVDRVETGYDANARIISITGRDTMGIIVDSYCEEFVTIRNSTLISVAEKLLKKVPFITSIDFDPVADKRDATKPYIQIEPGQRIFDVLKDIAMSRGLVFYSNPKGGLVFRKPCGKGKVKFSINQNFDRNNRSIISGTLIDDITDRYSKYTVLSQEQGGDSTEINSIATVIDDNFPSTIYKPFVDAVADDKVSCKKMAQWYLEHARSKSHSVQYEFNGHSQHIYNWAIDEIAHINDKVLGINEDLLVYSRTFRGSSNAQTTQVRLGLPGLVA
jgi:prophage tail gpP-like protein